MRARVSLAAFLRESIESERAGATKKKKRSCTGSSSGSSATTPWVKRESSAEILPGSFGESSMELPSQLIAGLSFVPRHYVALASNGYQVGRADRAVYIYIYIAYGDE